MGERFERHRQPWTPEEIQKHHRLAIAGHAQTPLPPFVEVLFSYGVIHGTGLAERPVEMLGVARWRSLT